MDAVDENVNARTSPTLLLVLLVTAACGAEGSGPAGPREPVGPGARAFAARGGSPALVEKGRRLFFEETFGGNGRTCGTCHPPPTLVLTPADIAELPPDDPFFAGTMDFDPEMAARGMIRYPLGGASLFEPETTVFRGIPTVRNVGRTGPFTADGRATALQPQALEAVMLHLLDGAVDEPGERLPTPDELDAIAAFQESVAEPEPGLGLGPLSGPARRGRELFFGAAACAECHTPPLFTDNEFHDIVAEGPGESVTDPGRCRIEPSLADCVASAGDAGHGTAFNTPQLRGVAETAPFFHDNSLPTLRAVVEFYDSPRFSESPAARRLGIESLELTKEEKADLVAFLEEI
ncbi:MAG: cytochrome-c peroxidase [Gemmatimonadota bacterium]